MRILELTGVFPSSIHELLEIARQETVILRHTNSQGFVLAPIDEFALEVELLRNNKEFMTYLDEIFQQEATISLAEVEKELGW